jgi:acyl carrier protein
MVPTWILPIARLPLTANGKIDRRKLPEPSEQATPSASTSIRQPTDDVELRVSNCWTQVLARPGVDVDSSFFDVGGDSLRLLRLQLALQDEFNHEISLALLFECQTIRSLASRLRSIT